MDIAKIFSSYLQTFDVRLGDVRIPEFVLSSELTSSRLHKFTSTNLCMNLGEQQRIGAD